MSDYFFVLFFVTVHATRSFIYYCIHCVVMSRIRNFFLKGISL